MSQESEQNDTKDVKDQAMGLIGMLAQAIEGLKTLGVISSDTDTVIGATPEVSAPILPEAVITTPEATEPEQPRPISADPMKAKKAEIIRGSDGKFISAKTAESGSVTSDTVNKVLRIRKKAMPAPKHKYPAPDTVDMFVTWFYATPEKDLYSCKCGQYEVKLGSKTAGTANVLLFHSKTEHHHGSDDPETGINKHASNVIGVRPLDSDTGVFNASRIVYGTSHNAQKRPQEAAEAAGAIPVPFENVVIEEGGAGLDLTKLEIVAWDKATDIIIPPVQGKRRRTWAGNFYVVSRHFAGAMVLKVEDDYFLFDCDQEELNYFNFNPFFTHLPGKVATVQEAYELLKPDEVKEAEAKGIDVKRQGEFFFVKADQDLFAAEATGKTRNTAFKYGMTLMLYDTVMHMIDVVGQNKYLQSSKIMAYDVSEFLRRCVEHNNGYLPEGNSLETTVTPRGKQSGKTALEIFTPLLDRYRASIEITHPIFTTAISLEMPKSVASKECETKTYSLMTMPLYGFRTATAYVSSVARSLADTLGLRSLMREVSSILSYRTIGIGGSATDIKADGWAAKAWGIYYDLKLGANNDTGTRNSHVATATRMDGDDVYARGCVSHSGREHHDLFLPAWYKVYSNTATVNWTVSGDVD